VTINFDSTLCFQRHLTVVFCTIQAMKLVFITGLSFSVTAKKLAFGGFTHFTSCNKNDHLPHNTLAS